MCGNRLRVLYVDDSEPILVSRKAYLERFGYEVVTANTGAAAMAKTRDGCPAVAVMDYELPDMTGVELAQRLKQEFPQLPLLLLSGTMAEELDLPATLFDSVLLKGSRPAELLEVLGELLARAGGARQK